LRKKNKKELKVNAKTKISYELSKTKRNKNNGLKKRKKKLLNFNANKKKLQKRSKKDYTKNRRKKKHPPLKLKIILK